MRGQIQWEGKLVHLLRIKGIITITSSQRQEGPPDMAPYLMKKKKKTREARRNAKHPGEGLCGMGAAAGTSRSF